MASILKVTSVEQLFHELRSFAASVASHFDRSIDSSAEVEVDPPQASAQIVSSCYSAPVRERDPMPPLLPLAPPVPLAALLLLLRWPRG